jgi:hypothetical protein
LSVAVAKALGTVVPVHSKERPVAEPEFQRLEQVLKPLDDRHLQQQIKRGLLDPREEDKLTSKLHRKNEAQVADRQTGFGYREQLIPDGLEDPFLHIQAAKRLKHPFDAEVTFQPDIEAALHSLADVSFDINSWRLSNLEWLKAKALELQSKKKEWDARASETCKKLKCKAHIPLMLMMQDLCQIEDREAPLL